MQENFGIMDKAYFVSRKEILDFFNRTLSLNYEKIEQLGTGAAYCQLIDLLSEGRPEVAAVKKQFNQLSWDAKFPHQYVNNYKILQKYFKALSVKKYVEVEKLVKCKPLDNVEFAQWCKAFFEANGGGKSSDYDPVARRKGKGAVKSTIKKVDNTKQEQQAPVVNQKRKAEQDLQKEEKIEKKMQSPLKDTTDQSNVQQQDQQQSNDQQKLSTDSQIQQKNQEESINENSNLDKENVQLLQSN